MRNYSGMVGDIIEVAVADGKLNATVFEKLRVES